MFHFFLAGALIGALVFFGSASAGLDVYKQEAGCKHITPNLQPMIDEAKNLHERIVTIKDQVNLAWVPG